MPKVEIDYSNTIIYKIICKDQLITDTYVGYTTNFVQRKHAHKQTCNNVKSQSFNLKLYKTIREHGNWSNWLMTVVNIYNCKNILEVRQKEYEYIVSLNATLNEIEHISNPKPIQVSSINNTIDNTNKYKCSHCNINCSKKSHYDDHINTIKHKNTLKMLNNINIDKKSNIVNVTCVCGHNYKYLSGLSRHKKTCITLKNKDKEISDKEMMMTILKENSELKTMILDMCKTMTASAGTTNNNTVNNTTNNTNNFNLNVFLNETCKDALNLTDFVSSLVVKLKDLEETAKTGYTEGVSRIFINGLNELDINMRPIHCSDAKRETLYIKNNDEWTKEDYDKSNITKAVKKVSNKNINQIFEWQKKYPEYNNPESKQNDKYQEMIFTAMGGSTDEEQSKNLDKIIRNITKEVIIDKNV